MVSQSSVLSSGSIFSVENPASTPARSGEPSLYVGESSRSLHERAREHWADADKGVEECHMTEHKHAAHIGEGGKPSFRFKVVKGWRTALEG